MCRHDGLAVSAASVLRLLRDGGLLLEANYQRERRQLAARRKAAFRRRTDRTQPGVAAGLHRVRDHLRRDLAAGRLPGLLVEVRAWVARLADGEPARRRRGGRARPRRGRTLAGCPLRELAKRDADGNVQPLVTVVTDNGGPFRSIRFEGFIATHPELRHVRTRELTPGQNGSGEGGFGRFGR
jgi:putative transposase